MLAIECHLSRAYATCRESSIVDRWCGSHWIQSTLRGRHRAAGPYLSPSNGANSLSPGSTTTVTA